ncbi:MAG: NAD(P)-dependent alcohol dehydrogenase, partial [Actinomycetota bacterium]|nr:NAD(P)-dependent alcohol dehydrogenase [Actinomycetota bacterium]
MTPGRPVPPPLARPVMPNDVVADPAGLDTDPGTGLLAAAYGAVSPDSGLAPLTIARRAPKA